MPDPTAVLARWSDLLTECGRLVLVEGRWGTGVGLAAEEAVALVRATGRAAGLTRLSDPVYWGGPVTDERYVVVGTRVSS